MSGKLSLFDLGNVKIYYNGRLAVESSSRTTSWRVLHVGLHDIELRRYVFIQFPCVFTPISICVSVGGQ